MKRLFFKKNLILKTALLLFLFISIFFSLNFFYNLNKGILASEEGEVEEVEYEKLKCGREIPVGEAMEKTGEFLEEIIRDLEKIETNSYFLIEAQKEMEELAKKCSIKNCTPKCEFFIIDNVELPVCISKSCQGDPCPEKEKEKIEKLFSNITNFNEEIQEAKDKIYKLIYEKVEPLCIKENEDIRTTGEKIQCANPACWELTQEILLSLSLEDFLEKIGLCPTITIQEAIGRKLNLSRGEFDKCYVSSEDIEKIFRGEKTGKYLLNCPIVSKEDYPRYTKTDVEIDEEKIPVCTSLHNWFCCFDVPQ